jgi:hypothetical protein
MSVECGKCERDLRGPHEVTCSRNPWPPEWPGFRLLLGGHIAPADTIVEGVEPLADGLDRRGQTRKRYGIGLRVPNEKALSFAARNDNLRHPRDGWFGLVSPIDDLAALTPAAEEMLALARGDQ